MSDSNATPSTVQQPGLGSGVTRERFASRLGFMLISAGCAIGLGNVWRFPYITGEYGGAAFVLLYLVFLVILGVPVMVMEFAVGRASQRSAGKAFDVLAPEKKGWRFYKWWAYAGNVLLMMFYTVVCGWMFSYVLKTALGTFNNASVEEIGSVFGAMLSSPTELIGWALVTIVLGFLVCSLGLQNGVERITKIMMSALFVVMLVLVVRSVTLPGAAEGLAFYLVPDFSKMFVDGWASFGDAVYAAMGQSFFTLSTGIAAMTIFGSYIGKERALTGEAVRICGLDTLVALLAGLIIFPACFAFGVSPDQGPSLVFVTLPSVFNQMPLGQLWGTLFFVFLSFAALSTVIAVFENIIAMTCDRFGITRRQAVIRSAILITVLSLPCALGFNVWSGIEIPAIGDIQGIEDFIVSNNLLPLGSLIYVLFCVHRFGWGWDNFVKEADTGEGLKFPKWARPWLAYGVPTLILIIFVMGYAPKVALWFGLS